MSQHVRRTHFADELSVQTPTAGVGKAFRFDKDILCRGNRSPAQQDCNETRSHDISLQIALSGLIGGQANSGSLQRRRTSDHWIVRRSILRGQPVEWKSRRPAAEDYSSRGEE